MDALGRYSDCYDAVFVLLPSGKTNAQIADELGLREITVGTIIRGLTKRHGVRKKTELAALAMRINDNEQRRRFNSSS